MATSNHKLFVHFSLACFFWFTAAGTAVADPYYTLTDLGNVGDYPQAVLPYPNSYATLPQSDFASRPGVTGWQGVSKYSPNVFPDADFRLQQRRHGHRRSAVRSQPRGTVFDADDGLRHRVSQRSMVRVHPIGDIRHRGTEQSEQPDTRQRRPGQRIAR